MDRLCRGVWHDHGGGFVCRLYHGQFNTPGGPTTRVVSAAFRSRLSGTTQSVVALCVVKDMDDFIDQSCKKKRHTRFLFRHVSFPITFLVFIVMAVQNSY